MGIYSYNLLFKTHLSFAATHLQKNLELYNNIDQKKIYSNKFTCGTQ